MMGWVATWIGLLGLASQDEDARQVMNRQDRISQALVKKLSDDAVWTRATFEEGREKAEALLEDLKLASFLRSKWLLPILAKHFFYSPYLREPLGLVSPLTQFPVAGCLAACGMPAVETFLRVLRDTEPEPQGVDEREVFDTRRARKIAIIGLISVYEQGGFPKELARARITLEAEKTEGPGRQRLLHALKEGLFAVDK